MINHQLLLKHITHAGVILTMIFLIPGVISVVQGETLPTNTETTTNELKITSVEHNISDRNISVGETLIITIQGSEGVQASVLLLGDKQWIKEYKAVETTPGVYVVNLILNHGDRVTEGAILARLQQGSKVVYSAVTQAFTVSPSQNPTPSSQPSQTDIPPSAIAPSQNVSLPLDITSHQNGQQIANGGLTIEGKTQPNAEVQIKVTSNLPLIENLIQIEGDTLIERNIIADSQGNFAIAVPQNANAPKGLQYQITATAFDASSQSPLVQLTLIQK